MPLVRRHKDPPKVSTRPSKKNAQLANEKRYVSTTDLFKAASTGVHKRPAPALSRKPLNTPKKIRTTILASSSPPTPRPNIHPLLEDFNADLAVYRDKVTATSHSALQPIHDKLVDRLASGPSVPKLSDLNSSTFAARLDQGVELSSTISRPLGEDSVKVRFRNNQGDSVQGRIALGNTINRFEALRSAKERELQDLWKEWEDVRQEIAELGAELLGDASYPTQFGLAAPSRKSRVVRPHSVEDERVITLRDEVRVECEKSRRACAKEAQEDLQTRKLKRDQWLELLKQGL